MTYSHDTLSKAFDAVADPDDWRAPIAVWLPGEAVNLAVAAIRFFTATTPKVELDMRRMKFLVTSEGYRAGPAGDH